MSSSFDPFAIIKQQQEENKYRTQILDLREVAEHPKNDFPIRQEEVESLADSILKSGGVLQFPLVRLLEDGSYQMLAGHKRRRASLLLGKSIDEKYFRTMCYVIENVSDERAELYLIDTNIQARNLSPKLRAQKVAEARELIETLMSRGEIEKTNIKNAVAEHTGISPSTVILQNRIAKNLSEELLELYDRGEFTMREAYDYSGLSQEAQAKIAEACRRSDLTKEEFREEVMRVILKEKLMLGEPTPHQKEAERKAKQAAQCLKALAKLKADGITLDRDSLFQLRESLEGLLRQ